MLEPPVPELQNTDGETLSICHSRFDVQDRHGLCADLDRAADFDRSTPDKPAWHWSGTNARGEPVVLGTAVLEGDRLLVECNSADRGVRGRQRIEALAGNAVRHRSTTVQGLREDLQRALRGGGAGAAADAAEEGPPEGTANLPADLAEALILDRLDRHYHDWLDEAIPALDGRTPREAAADFALRPRLAGLIRTLEGDYQRSLAQGHPAYDPSWLWDELGLDDGRPRAQSLALAHDRIETHAPGIGAWCRDEAGRRRERPDFDAAATVMRAGDFRDQLWYLRLLHDGPEDLAAAAERWATYLCNYELHRRRTFLVDEALAYMLAQTAPEVLGRDLRVPFPAFALCYTDRLFLSRAERQIAKEPGCRLAGQILRAAMVFVFEDRNGPDRTLHLGFALDSHGADPPLLLTHDMPLADDDRIDHFVASLAPAGAGDLPVAQWHALAGMVRVAMNTIL